MTHDNPAVHEIMTTYTPVEVKKLIDRSTDKEFVHHQRPEDIMKFYAEHDMYIHHWLLDDTYAFQFYIKLQAAYNEAQQGQDEESRFAVQTLYIKDVVYLFIATVAWDLAASHDLLYKTLEEVEDYQLNIDLNHRKKQLHVIDGGKS
tara:strand:- start:195 stop:635 length:441 start_codon:yes stop_codon:yes gene_type:complete